MAECDIREAKRAAADHMQHLAGRALELCKLEAGWDNAEAAPVDREALAHAMSLAAGITCPECLQPDITPTRSGNVLLSWTHGADHVEIEVNAKNDFDVLIELPDCRLEQTFSEPHDALLAWLAHQVTAVGLSRFANSL